MRVLIDTSEEGIIHFAFFISGAWQFFDVLREPGGLAAAFFGLLAKNGLKLEALSGVAVVVGQGRFTATRVATVTANTLAYSLKIPVAAVRAFDTALADAALSAAPLGRYAHPEYSAAARIGGKVQ